MGRVVKQLTDSKIKSLKVKDKDYTEPDGQGLQILIKTIGTKLWEFRYVSPLTNKRKKTSFGCYPNVSLVNARKKRNEYLEFLANGIDPIEFNREEKKKKDIEANKKIHTMIKISNEFFELQQNNKGLKDKTIILSKNRLQNHFFNYLPSKENTIIHDITFLNANEILKKMEKSNKLDTLKRVKQLIISIFKYAYTEGIIENTNIITKLELKTFKLNKEVRNNPTLTKKEEIQEMYNKILAYKSSLIVKYLVLFSIHTAQRQNSIIQAKWEDIDFDKKIWFIPRNNMKGNVSIAKDHNVPLSDILIKYLKDLREITGSNEYLFPNSQLRATRNKNPYISNNTTRKALRNMGYTNEQQTAHGFRAMFKTVCKEHQEEHNLNNEFVERVLAHKIDGDVESVYNRANNIEDMRKILNWWSEYLESLI